MSLHVFKDVYNYSRAIFWLLRLKPLRLAVVVNACSDPEMHAQIQDYILVAHIALTPRPLDISHKVLED